MPEEDPLKNASPNDLKYQQLCRDLKYIKTEMELVSQKHKDLAEKFCNAMTKKFRTYNHDPEYLSYLTFLPITDQELAEIWLRRIEPVENDPHFRQLEQKRSLTQQLLRDLAIQQLLDESNDSSQGEETYAGCEDEAAINRPAFFLSTSRFFDVDGTKFKAEIERIDNELSVCISAPDGHTLTREAWNEKTKELTARVIRDEHRRSAAGNDNI